jgi:predicted Ser/Thr protein kinase
MYSLLFFLGRGANGMVYQIEYQNIQFAMKISNKNSTKEYNTAEKMQIISININQM